MNDLMSGRFRLLVASVAGAEVSVLMQCNPGVQSARARWGELVLFCAIVSALAMAGAWNMILESPIWGSATGILWFFGFLSMESIVLSMTDGLDCRRRSALATRIGMALILSVFSGHAINLIVFGPEIMRTHREEVRALIAAEDKKLSAATQAFTAWRDAERARIDVALATVRDDLNTLDLEVKGVKTAKTTGRSGRGPVSAEREDTLRLSKDNLERERASLEEAIKNGPQALIFQRAQEAHKERVEEISAQGFGIVERSAALWEIFWKDPFVVTILYLLFFGIEVVAVIFKFTKRKDEYDLKIEETLYKDATAAQDVMRERRAQEARDRKEAEQVAKDEEIQRQRERENEERERAHAAAREGIQKREEIEKLQHKAQGQEAERAATLKERVAEIEHARRIASIDRQKDEQIKKEEAGTAVEVAVAQQKEDSGAAREKIHGNSLEEKEREIAYAAARARAANAESIALTAEIEVIRKKLNFFQLQRKIDAVA